MEKTQRWRVAFGEPFILRENDDDNDDSGEGAKPWQDDINAVVAKLRRDLKKTQAENKSGIESMMSSIDAMVDKILEGDDSGAPPGGNAPTNNGNDNGAPPPDDSIPHGFRAELDRLKREVEREKKAREEAQRNADERDKRLSEERRMHKLSNMLSERGARNIDHVAKLIFPEIISDEEIGDAVTIKTDAGEDIVPLSSYVERFAEENDYLFEQPGAKSGSGGGGGSAPGRGKKATVTQEQLADPKKGGMSWDEYEKNQDAIRAKIEEQVRGK